MSFQQIDLSDRKRPKGRNMVILYGFSSLDMEKLTKAVIESGIDGWIYIDSKRAGMKIKDIIKKESDNQGMVFKKEKEGVILFNATSQHELQGFVTAARAAVKERPYIAVVTETSKNWIFKDLISELKSERMELDRNRS